MEIGSEFFLEFTSEECNKNGRIPHFLNEYGYVSLTSSGRSAYSLLLKKIEIKNKKVLLPAYICESVIKSFEVNGYECSFYNINHNLEPESNLFDREIDYGIFLHMGYFGVQTNSNLQEFLKYLKSSSVLIIEDVTHSLFANRIYEETDFYIGSIRKWLGIPSGGFLGSKKELSEEGNVIHEEFVHERIQALKNKRKYILEGNNFSKKIFLEQFYDAELILDNDFSVYTIDNMSKNILLNFDFAEMKKQRRINFFELLVGLKDLELIEPLFTNLEEDECPLFFPIFINRERDHIKSKLIEERIYCPVHWPVPKSISKLQKELDLSLYNKILSIPCDQRYGVKEMQRIIDVFKRL